MRRYDQRVRDGYSYDGGNLATGIRRVRKGGRVKFDHHWHQDNALLPYVGKWVRVEAEDCWINEKVPCYHYHGGFICYARNESRTPTEIPKI